LVLFLRQHQEGHLQNRLERQWVPHEQKLRDVVNSLTSKSFNFWVLARIFERSIKLLSASPAQPPALL